jgi:NAD(P)-dependent dehydrogenase (short-subunit alcohol dehydrogenase family)
MIGRRPRRDLAGQVAIVTGASSGLGRELALALAGEGMSLALAARGREPLQAVANDCRGKGAAVEVVPTDVTDDAACAELCARTVATFGGIDGIIACAGLGMWGRFADIEDIDVLQRVMAVNFWGLVQPVRYALPHLREREGFLVAISSVQGRLGVPWHSGYAAAKHAVQGFCNSLRIEESPPIDVTTVLAHWLSGTDLRARALGPDGVPRAAAARRHGRDAVAANVAAQRVVTALRARRRCLWIPGHLRFLGLLAEVAPATADGLIRRRMVREDSGKS